MSSVDDILFQLPSFVLATHPAKNLIERAIADRDGLGLRSALATATTDDALTMLLTSIALHFEGDGGTSRCTLQSIWDSTLGRPALFVAASVAIDQRQFARR